MNKILWVRLYNQLDVRLQKFFKNKYILISIENEIQENYRLCCKDDSGIWNIDFLAKYIQVLSK